MFAVTINGNNTAELITNMETMLANLKQTSTAFATTPAQPTAPAIPEARVPVNPSQPAAAPTNYATPAAPAQPNNAPPVPAAAPVPFATAPQPTMPNGATTAANQPPEAPAYQQPPAAPVIPPLAPGSPMAQPPQAPAPTYTLEQLANAGATLAQSGKMEQALALLARYGVQSLGQLKPEMYGAFATELRALGAQV